MSHMLLRTITSLMLFGLFACGGCSGSGHATTDYTVSSLTEAQRDSAIARSSLPGASTVGRALTLSGKSERRAAQMDSLTR
jgi:uncharacterized metal-binding protein